MFPSHWAYGRFLDHHWVCPCLSGRDFTEPEDKAVWQAPLATLLSPCCQLAPRSLAHGVCTVHWVLLLGLLSYLVSLHRRCWPSQVRLGEQYWKFNMGAYMKCSISAFPHLLNQNSASLSLLFSIFLFWHIFIVHHTGELLFIYVFCVCRNIAICSFGSTCYVLVNMHICVETRSWQCLSQWLSP